MEILRVGVIRQGGRIWAGNQYNKETLYFISLEAILGPLVKTILNEFYINW